MKKYSIVLILFFNLVPGIREGALQFGSAVYGQSMGQEEAEVCVRMDGSNFIGTFGSYEIWETCSTHYDCQSGEEYDVDCSEEYIYVGWDEEEELDCDGVPGGDAYESSCGCVGGTTGIPYCDEDDEPQDCAGVAGGSAYEAECGCIGGSTGISSCPEEEPQCRNCEQNDPLADFCDNMTPETRELVNNALADVKIDYENDLSCGRIYMYNSLKSTMSNITFCLDAIPDRNGGYNPVNKNITFKEGVPFNSTVLAHELFHAYQDNSGAYVNGIAQYATGAGIGYPNIEFEAVLYDDILKNDHNFLSAFYTGSQIDQVDYKTFLISITNNGTTKPTSFTPVQAAAYYDLVERYNQHKGYGKITDTNLLPNAMFMMFNNLNCP